MIKARTNNDIAITPKILLIEMNWLKKVPKKEPIGNEQSTIIVIILDTLPKISLGEAKAIKVFVVMLIIEIPVPRKTEKKVPI